MPQGATVLLTRAIFSSHLSLWSRSPLPLFQWTDWSPVRVWSCDFPLLGLEVHPGTSVVHCALVSGRGGSLHSQGQPNTSIWAFRVIVQSNREELPSSIQKMMPFLKQKAKLASTSSFRLNLLLYWFMCVCFFLIPQGISSKNIGGNKKVSNLRFSVF